MMLSDLPEECFIHVCKNLQTTDLITLSGLSEEFYFKIHSYSTIWRKVILSTEEGPLCLTDSEIRDVLNHGKYMEHLEMPYLDISLSSSETDYLFCLNFLDSKITYLDLSGAAISTLCFLFELKSLKTLILSDCYQISDFYVLKSLDLIYLDVSFTKIGATEVLPQIGHDMEVLKAHSVEFSVDTIGTVLCNNPKLKYLTCNLYNYDSIILQQTRNNYPNCDIVLSNIHHK